MKIIITSPSLDPSENVSGVSSVTQFIISNNFSVEYVHFKLGKKDNEKGGLQRIAKVAKSFLLWMSVLSHYPDAIIHYNFPLSKSSILRDPLFMFWARLCKRKMIIHLHGGDFLETKPTSYYLNFILQKVFSFSIPFIVLSEREKNIILDKYHCPNIQVLPNCVELEKAQQFKKLESKNDKLVVGYLGRIAETKGMDYLLKAFKILKQNNIPFVLKMAGKEETKDQYLPLFKKELSESFMYEGVVSGDIKEKFLSDLDVFVLPSYFEGLPMSLLESMSYAVVPLVTKVGSIEEVVRDKSNGLFIKIKDTDSIIQQFTLLHNNRDKLNLLSKAARETIFGNYSPINYVQELNKIYSMA